jgi:hypothetical protein
MRGVVATLAIAGCLLAMTPTEAAAWVCRADGFGSSAVVRSTSVVRAKRAALRACERRSAFHVCTILYCRR